jgi:hypothetical protein
MLRTRPRIGQADLLRPTIASPCAMIIGSGNAQEPDAHLA